MERYNNLKSMPQSTDRDSEIGHLMIRLEEIAKEAKSSPMPDIQELSKDELLALGIAASPLQTPGPTLLDPTNAGSPGMKGS